MQRLTLSLLAAVVLSLVPCCSTAPPALTAPVAPKDPTVREMHGERFTDDYAWLRHRKDPRTFAYLTAENSYTEQALRPTEPLQKKLYKEMLSRIQEEDTSAPYRKGGYWYYARTEKGKPYAIHCRRKGSLDAPEGVLLDGNALGAHEEYFRIGVFDVSDDHRLLAYSVDTNGSEKYTLRFKDLSTGAMLPDEIAGTYYGGAWAADNRTFFYVTVDDAVRPYRLWRHTLGDAPASDSLVHEEKDERYFLSAGRSRCGRFVLISLESMATNEWWTIDAANPANAPRVIAERREGVEYSVDAAPGSFFILTNDGTRNFKLVEAPIDSPGTANWKTILPGRETVTLEEVDCFKGFYTVRERENGLQHLYLFAYGVAAQADEIEIPEAAYALSGGDNEEYSPTTLRYEYASPTTPESVFDYDLASGRSTLIKRQPVPNFDSSKYTVERRFAPAPDGKQVPVTILRRKDCPADGSAPGLLEAYGSYGFAFDPRFNSNVFSLIDRGMVYAIGHIRGGADMGRGWYEDGRLRNKRNTFTDFIAAAEFLQREGYVAKDRLAITGGSAGGLLMGAVVNMRPDLFKCIVAEVPFVDVMNTMLDPTIPLTVTEWEQWGDPRNAEDYAYMRTYSPYDNVEAKAYPSMLITAGLNDPRVAYWEPTKWAARLRALKTDRNLLLLRTNMEAGHGGASGRYEALEEQAIQYAFILDRLGVERMIREHR